MTTDKAILFADLIPLRDRLADYNFTSQVTATPSIDKPDPLAEKAYEKDLEFFSSSIGLGKKELERYYSRYSVREKAYKSQGLYMGVNPDDLSGSAKSRNVGNNTQYINDRTKVLNDLMKVLQVSQSPAHLHNFFTSSERSFHQIAGSTELQSPHFKEALEAAKYAVSKNQPHLTNVLNQDPLALVYNPIIRELTATELMRRAEALSGLNGESISYMNDGVIGKVADFGPGNALVAGSTLGYIGKGLDKYAGIGCLNAGPSWAAAAKSLERSGVGCSEGLAVNFLKGHAHIEGFLSPKQLKKHSNPLSAIKYLFTTNKVGQENPLTINWSNGTKAQYANYDEFYASMRKQHVNFKLSGLRQTLKSSTGLTKLQPATQLFRAQGGSLLSLMGRHKGVTGALIAGAAWLFMQATNNPTWSDGIKDTTSDISSKVTSLASGIGNFALQWFLPDLGILYGRPWFKEGAVA